MQNRQKILSRSNMHTRTIHEEQFTLFSILQSLKKRQQTLFMLSNIILISEIANQNQIQQLFSYLYSIVSLFRTKKSLIITYMQNTSQIMLNFTKSFQNQHSNLIVFDKQGQQILITSNLKKIKLNTALNSIVVKQSLKNKCLKVTNLQMLANYLNQYETNAEEKLRQFLRHVILQECNQIRKIIKYASLEQAVNKINQCKPLICEQADVLFQPFRKQRLKQNQSNSFSSILYSSQSTNYQNYRLYIGDQSLMNEKICLSFEFYKDLLKYVVKSLALPLLLSKIKKCLILTAFTKYICKMSLRLKQKQCRQKIEQYITGKLFCTQHTLKLTHLKEKKLQNYLTTFVIFRTISRKQNEKNKKLISKYAQTYFTMSNFQKRKKQYFCIQLQSNIRKYLDRKNWFNKSMKEYLQFNRKTQFQNSIKYQNLKQMFNSRVRKLQIKAFHAKIKPFIICSQIELIHISNVCNIQMFSPHALQIFFFKVISRIQKYYEKTVKLLKIVKIQIFKLSIRVILDNGFYFQYGIIQNQTQQNRKIYKHKRLRQASNKQNISPNIPVRQKLIESKYADVKFLIDSYGRVFCQGNNQHHQLGLKDPIYYQKFTKLPIQNKVKEIVIGVNNVACLTQQLKIYLWGTEYPQPVQIDNTLKIHEKKNMVKRIVINTETVLAQLTNGNIKDLLKQTIFKSFMISSSHEVIQQQKKQQDNISRSESISTKYASTRTKQSTSRSLCNILSQKKISQTISLLPVKCLQVNHKAKQNGITNHTCLKTIGNQFLEITYYIRYSIKTYDKIKQKEIVDWMESQYTAIALNNQPLQELLLD